MQDIHSIDAGGRIFSGGGADRRIRPHNHQNHQALKCPRCDSLNTKFCYYNNYNLSQPRHFCKNCRRYWTKGGVLRNVPVGGGCRKAKRAKTKASSETATETPSQQQRDQRKSNSHSSSESSSLTAANSNVAVTNGASSSAGGTAEAVSAQSSHTNLLTTTDSKFYVHGNPNPSFESGLLEQGSDCGIFSDIGTFTSLITSSSNEPLSFGFGTTLNQHVLGPDQEHQWHSQSQLKTIMAGEEITAGGLLDQTVQVELSALQSRSNGGELGPLDWPGNGDQGLFDLPNTVDHTYWSQSQWTDQDHPSLYLP
ncbi:hypothetical protein SLE2022_365210 [Rubroshorea leprosula]